MSAPRTTIAGALTGEDLDRAIEFGVRLRPGAVDARITGVIREIHHDAEGVTLWVANVRDDAGGEKHCFENLYPATIITFVAA